MADGGLVSLKLLVTGAKNLKVIKGFGRQNPYFNASMSHEPKVHKRSRTHTDGNDAPIWNEHIDFMLHRFEGASLHFDIRSDIPSDALIGVCDILVSDIIQNAEGRPLAMAVKVSTGGELLAECTWSRRLTQNSNYEYDGSSVDEILNKMPQYKHHKCPVYVFGESGVGVSSICNLLKVALRQFCQELQCNRAVQEIISKNVSFFENETALPSPAEHAVLLYVYDVCDEKSLEGAIARQKRGSSFPSTYLVGNKMDLEYWRQVPVAKGEAMARAMKAKFCEVSALSGQHIDHLLDVVLCKVFPSVFQEEGIRYLLSAIRTERDDRKVGELLQLAVNELEHIPPKHVGLGGIMSTDLSEGGISLGNVKKKAKKSKHSIDSTPARPSANSVPPPIGDPHLLRGAPSPQVPSAPRRGSGPPRSPPRGLLKARSKREETEEITRQALDRLRNQQAETLEISGFDSRARRQGKQFAPPPPPPKVAQSPFLPPPGMAAPAPPASQAFDAFMPSPSPSAAPASSDDMFNLLQEMGDINILAGGDAGGGVGAPEAPSDDFADFVTDGINYKLKEEEEEEEEEECEESDNNLAENSLAKMLLDDDDDYDEDEEVSDEDSYEDSVSICSSEDEVDEEPESAQAQQAQLQPTMRIDELQRVIDGVKSIMSENIDGVLARGDTLEDIERQAEELQASSGVFLRKSTVRIQKRMRLFRVLCCCAWCSEVCTYCKNDCLSDTKTCWKGFLTRTGELLGDIIGLFTKKGLMDNVLADNENAFQTLAKLLAYLIDMHLDEEVVVNRIYYCLIGVWVDFLNWACSYMVVLSSTLVLILPSFFTLLIVRTATIEKESKAFGVRQEAIRVEKKEESAIRWVRIVLRSLPMTFFLLALPYLLVFRIFPTVDNDTIKMYLVLYFVGVIVLQLLGSVRSYYSWKSKDVKPPKAPTMYYREEIPASLLSKLNCFSNSESGHKKLTAGDHLSMNEADKKFITKKTPIPSAANKFNYTQTANIMELASLSLEFFQMATFSMQNNPYTASEEAPTSMPTMSPSASGVTVTGASTEDKFWGTTVFESVYVNFPVGSDLSYIIMWSSVGLVALLMVVFSTQFLFELRRYGCLMRKVKDKDKARDSFFYSFTGAIVYGHGNPNNISDNMRLLVATLSDGLFLVISLQLLQVFACDYSSADSVATLRADPSIVCWEGQHATLAVAALISYAFYVPLSIMITPMLLEAPRPDDGTQDTGGGVTYAKLYLMTINVVKSVMLLVGVLGPQGVFPVVISSTIASYVLGNITYFWFRSSVKSLKDPNSKVNYFTTMQPCNVAFINYWKAASYTAAVMSAVVVAVAHELDSEEFPMSMLTTVLLATWGGIILCFATAYYLFHRETSSRSHLLDELINYPFFWRDLKEEVNGTVDEKPDSECLWLMTPQVGHDQRSIPGFDVSPWHDSLAKKASLNSEIESSASPLNPMTGTLSNASVVTYDGDRSSFSWKVMHRNEY